MESPSRFHCRSIVQSSVWRTAFTRNDDTGQRNERSYMLGVCYTVTHNITLKAVLPVCVTQFTSLCYLRRASFGTKAKELWTALVQIRKTVVRCIFLYFVKSTRILLNTSKLLTPKHSVKLVSTILDRQTGHQSSAALSPHNRTWCKT